MSSSRSKGIISDLSPAARRFYFIFLIYSGRQQAWVRIPIAGRYWCSTAVWPKCTGTSYQAAGKISPAQVNLATGTVPGEYTRVR